MHDSYWARLLDPLWTTDMGVAVQIDMVVATAPALTTALVFAVQSDGAVASSRRAGLAIRSSSPHSKMLALPSGPMLAPRSGARTLPPGPTLSMAQAQVPVLAWASVPVLDLMLRLRRELVSVQMMPPQVEAPIGRRIEPCPRPQSSFGAQPSQTAGGAFWKTAGPVAHGALAVRVQRLVAPVQVVVAAAPPSVVA